MSVINKKLGNGYLFNAVDSTKDQEHYFTNYKKHIAMLAEASLTGALLPVYSSGALDVSRGVLYDIAQDSSGTLFAVGEIPFRGVIIKSTDSGESWTNVLSNVSAAFYSIAISSSDKIYVVGASGSTNDVAHTVVFSSSDHGTNWGLVFRTSSVTDPDFDKTQLALSNNGTIAVSSVNSSNNVLKIFTSSQSAGASGTYGQVGTLTNATNIFCRDLLYSGSSLFVAGGSAFTGSIHSSSGYGSAAYGEVYIPPGTFGSSIRRIFMDSSGTLWAGGNYIFIYSTGGGKLNTWNTSSMNISSSLIFMASMAEDAYKNKFVFVNSNDFTSTSAQTTVYYNPSGSFDSWTVDGQYDGETLIAGSTGGKYQDLVVCGSSGSYFGRIYHYSTISATNQGKNRITASLPCDLVFGLVFKDAVKAIQFTDDQLFYCFGITQKQAQSYDFSLRFGFSGSFSNFQEISTNTVTALSGAWFNLVSIGKTDTLVVGDVSASFKTGRIVGYPNVRYIRVRLSGTAGSIVRIDPISFDYFQSLTDYGVRFFKNIENQDLQFAYLNASLLKKVE